MRKKWDKNETKFKFVHDIIRASQKSISSYLKNNLQLVEPLYQFNT